MSLPINDLSYILLLKLLSITDIDIALVYVNETYINIGNGQKFKL